MKQTPPPKKKQETALFFMTLHSIHTSTLAKTHTASQIPAAGESLKCTFLSSQEEAGMRVGMAVRCQMTMSGTYIKGATLSLESQTCLLLRK